MPFFLQQFQIDSHDWKFKMSLLNYVPRMLSWCTCLVTYVLSCSCRSCPTCFLATSVSCHTCSRASRVLCHTWPLSWRASCHTCSRALRSSCPTFSRASRASYLICSRTLRVLRTLVPHCLEPCVFSCYSCLVPYVLFCSSSPTCFRCFKPNILILQLLISGDLETNQFVCEDKNL